MVPFDTRTVSTNLLFMAFPWVIVVYCENLSEITSGSFDTRTDGSVTKVEYICASGYRLVGEANQTCGTGGKWTSTPPTCSTVS